jgi:putative transposase
MVHFYRNVFSHVPTTKVREVSHMLKAIHAQESRDAADRKARAIVDDLYQPSDWVTLGGFPNRW